MKLYDAAWAPSPRRVRIFLAEKGLEIARETIDLARGEQLGEAFLAVNPRGLVPTLQLDDGSVLDESSAICRYLEALHPDPPLFGRSAAEIGAIEAWTRRIEGDGYTAAVYAFRNASKYMIDRGISGRWPAIPQIPALVERAQLMWAGFIEALDARLADRAWIASDAFSYADITALVTLGFARATGLSDGAYPQGLARWHAAVSARPGAVD